MKLKPDRGDYVSMYTYMLDADSAKYSNSAGNQSDILSAT